MTRDDIIRMAKNEYGIYAFTAESLAEFATIIAAAEREKFKVHVAALVRDARHDATEREREVCARIADEWATREQKEFGNGGPGAAIRARGNQ